MPTVDELLNASNEVTTCTIDPDTREIIVPEKYKILGVFSDEKVTKIPFTCPKVVGNNVDLTEYNLYINYQNASGRRNAYLVDDVTVSGDNITFSWLLSRYVTLSPGVVTYSLCAKKLDGETTVTEWNTTIAKGTVIPGLETIQEIIEENPDIIETILSKMHTHDNEAVLDKFAESDGKPTYDGKALGGGTSDFIIKMTVEANDEIYTVTSCDKTMEQIDAAVASGQNIKAIAFDKYIMPLIQMEYGESYAFGAFLGSFLVAANAAKNPESGGDEWQFYLMPIPADIVGYSNAALPNVTDVEAALDNLVPNSHTHSNKETLDKLSVLNGKLQYNGSDVGLKGDKGADGKTPVKGTDYWTAADKAEIVTDTLAALPKWTGGSY